LLFNYARGVADRDDSETAEVRAELADYTFSLSRFVEEATKHAAPASVVRPKLEMHVDQLLQQTDAYARGDYGRAFALERESYAHMFRLGKALATGMVMGKVLRSRPSLTVRRSSCGHGWGCSWGEHAELAVDAIRSGVSNSPDFSAAAAVLDGNSRDLTAAIQSVFGGDSAARFQMLWADHIDAFVAYPRSLATNDATGRDAAGARLQQFNADFAGFLSTSTQGRVAAPGLADAFVMYEDLLMRQIDAYAKRDYRTAHQLSYDGFAPMFVLAADAATAVGNTVAADMPSGGAQMGGGGMVAIPSAH
jgi:hypothetical protein